MTKIFPEARDYRSINAPISAEMRQVIEKRLGYPLLPGQQDVFAYYEMTGERGRTLGYIMAPAQKGAFGAVEFVFGLDTALSVRGLYIQRSRERENDFKDKAFLAGFSGKKVKDADHLFQDPGASFSPGKKAVLEGLRKELVVFEETVLKKEGHRPVPAPAFSR